MMFIFKENEGDPHSKSLSCGFGARVKYQYLQKLYHFGKMYVRT